MEEMKSSLEKRKEANKEQHNKLGDMGKRKRQEASGVVTEKPPKVPDTKAVGRKAMATRNKRQ